MNFKRMRKPFVSFACIVSLLLSLIGVPVAAVDMNSVTATTSASVKQGTVAYCYVNIDSTEGLAALDITVHYDPAKVKITTVYNSVSCTLYDSVINADNVQFSYILDGQGTASKTRLFYFQYQVLSNADVGSAYFDITIGEAYDNSLNEVAVSGSRCSFTIAQTVANKSCNIYGSSSMSTAMEQEFTLSYRFSTYQIASGTVVITYDAELFEVVEVTPGAFLTGKVVDVNTDLIGELYVSFVGTEYYSNTNLVSVTFKTIKNVTETSKIVLKATELLDRELNSISCSGYTTNVNVAFDETHTGDSPAMRLDGTFSYEDMQVTLVVSLEANSNLGAGDFVITFDPKLVSYHSCTKGFAPSFFNINDKNAEAGELKFHIISLTDIVTEETILTIVFDVNHPYSCKTADFVLDGTGLTNSLTESILLNLIDGSVLLGYRVNFCDSNGTVLQSTMYHYGDMVLEPEAPTKESDLYGSYSFAGWDKAVTACISDVTYTATYSVTNHCFDTVTTGVTCTSAGKTVYTCTACNYSYNVTVPATGHSFADGICGACGEADPDYVKPVVKPTLTLKSPALEFKDMIKVIAFYTAENLDDVVEMGMITYTEQVDVVDINTAAHVIPGAIYDEGSGRYFSSSQGIFAKYLADTIYLACYAKLTDGTYVYTKLAPYSPITYAMNQLNYSTDMNVKQLVAAMLNYGAAAQLHFGYNVENLANASMTDEQKALPAVFADSMVNSVPTVSAEKQGIFVNNQGFSKRRPAISFEGAFSINYLFTPAYTPVDGITMYYWNEADFNAADVLSIDNATGSMEMVFNEDGQYRGDIEGIAAKNLANAVYVAAVYSDGTTTWTSGVLGYSIGAYCGRLATKGGAMADLAMATAVYGYHAKQYFGS